MTMVARVTAARVRLQIDVRFGDTVTPPPVRMDFRTTITAIAAFAAVPLAAVARGLPFGGHWLPGGPWA